MPCLQKILEHGLTACQVKHGLTPIKNPGYVYGIEWDSSVLCTSDMQLTESIAVPL